MRCESVLPLSTFSFWNREKGQLVVHNRKYINFTLKEMSCVARGYIKYRRMVYPIVTSVTSGAGLTGTHCRTPSDVYMRAVEGGSQGSPCSDSMLDRKQKGRSVLCENIFLSVS